MIRSNNCVLYFWLAILLTIPLHSEWQIKKGKLEKEIILTGRIEPAQAENFQAPQTDSWMTKIKWLAAEGSYIKTGEAVVQFEDSSLLAALESSLLDLESKQEEKRILQANVIQKELESATAVKKAEIDCQRKKIDADIPKGLIPDYDYQKYQLDLEKSKINLGKAKDNQKTTRNLLKSDLEKINLDIRQIQQKIETVRNKIQLLTLYAKSAGPLLYGMHPWRWLKIEPGESVPTTTKVAYIPQISSYQIWAWLPEAHYHQIRENSLVKIIFDAVPSRTFSGKIKTIYKHAQNIRNYGKTNYFQVIIIPEKTDFADLKPGMSCGCVIRSEAERETLLIPFQAVFFDGLKYWVYPEKKPGQEIIPLDYTIHYISVDPVTAGTLSAGDKLVPMPFVAGKTKP